jgi:hypothetical protein
MMMLTLYKSHNSSKHQHKAHTVVYFLNGQNYMRASHAHSQLPLVSSVARVNPASENSFEPVCSVAARRQLWA